MYHELGELETDNDLMPFVGHFERPLSPLIKRFLFEKLRDGLERL
jgi:hypothetical protein